MKVLNYENKFWNNSKPLETKTKIDENLIYMHMFIYLDMHSRNNKS